jgi:hypothetical protein
MQRRVAREAFMTDEVFLHFRHRRAENRLTAPLQIQMLPSEMLPLSHNSADANTVALTLRCGIIYWIETRHC